MDTSRLLSCEPKLSLAFPHEKTSSRPSARQKARAMLPLTGVGERCVPRATRVSALMSLTIPGRSRSASLPTPSRADSLSIACSALLA